MQLPYLLMPLALQLSKHSCQVGLALVPAAPCVKCSCQVALAELLQGLAPNLRRTTVRTYSCQKMAIVGLANITQGHSTAALWRPPYKSWCKQGNKVSSA